MSTIDQAFQPPLYWQQFEDLTAGAFRAVYGDPRPTKFGRPGQAQNGVDVYGYESGTDHLIAIQCKRMDEHDDKGNPLPGGAITRKILHRELKKARGFSPTPHTWVLATTAKRDAVIQRYALELNEEARKSGPFRIQLWFWDDFVTDLNRNYDLQQWYYDKVIKVHSSDDQDKIILEMLAEAFSRAAFRTPLYQETPSEFIQALKDTQAAINTGELKDRETRRVIRKTIGGRRAIADVTVGGYLKIADEKLHQLRVEFQHNMGIDMIRQCGTILAIPHQLQDSLNALRSEAIAAMNDALRHVGLKSI